ncbi:MAG: hypothetical protein KDI92_14200 [Xanthomonadales bacterium]|nr:hypothetical protein [Xanthomonadales bacterium]
MNDKEKLELINKKIEDLYKTSRLIGKKNIETIEPKTKDDVVYWAVVFISIIAFALTFWKVFFN